MQAAADPLSGTLSPETPSLSFTGSLSGSDPSGGSCVVAPNDSPTCDEFTLTVSLPAGYRSSHPNAKVRLSMTHDDIEYYLDVLDADSFDDIGNSSDNPAIVEFAPNNGNKNYLVDVSANIGTGGTYTTTITLLPGTAVATDADGDGVPDADDACPGTTAGTPVDSAGCPIENPPADADGDGVPDASDACPGTPAGSAVDSSGCVVVTADADNDGVADADDACPDTPAGTEVNSAGCPVVPTEARCIAPGLTVMTDPAGDQTGGADTDIVSVQISESVTTQRNLVFTVKMSSLASLTSNARRIFTFKAKGADYYVAMISSPESDTPVFVYGTGTSGFGGSDTLGNGLEGSGYNVNGTFTVVAPISAFGVAEGDVLGTFAGVTRLSGGACNVGCVNGAAADTATAPAGNTYTLTADGVCGVPEAPVSTEATGLAPRYQIHVSPKDLGNEAGEPSVGYNKHSKHSMFISYTQALRQTYQEDIVPPLLPASCPALWEDKSGTLTQVNSLDPILFTDEATGRTFNSQLSGDNSLMEFTDDDGENWTPAQAGPPNGGADHQAVATGVYPAGAQPLTASWPATGPKRAVYYCSQSVATAFCSRSDDGGATFGPGFTFKNTECAAGALHGHVKVAPDGTVYVPDSSQCVLPTGDSANHVIAFASGDAGQTWQVRPVPMSTGGDGSDPSIGIATDGTLYMCYPNADSTVHMAVSHDKGMTWSGGQDLGLPEGIVQTRFPQAIAGDRDRASCAFLGTKTAGNGDSLDFKGVWYGYIATTYDGGQSYHLVNVTPDDPVQGYGGVGPDGTNRNLLDFNDLQIDDQGRTYFGFADGCTGACVRNPANNAFEAKATIVRQTGGRSLYAKFDDVSALAPVRRYNVETPIEPAAACARQDLSSRSSTQADVVWNAPDTGGTAITNYKVYRSTSADGPFAFVGDAGASTRYADSTTSPSVEKYYYRVEAQNVKGIAPISNTIELVISTQAASTCAPPGEIIILDSTGDAQGGDDMDIVSVGVAEPRERPNDFVITEKIANFTAGLPPSTSFYVLLFPTLDNLYIALDSTEGPATFVYGHFDEDPAGQGFLIYTQDGTLPDSSFAADGTISFVVPRALLGNVAVGSDLVGFDARARLGASSANSRDTAGPSSYTVKGFDFCVDPNAPFALASLTADPLSGDAPLPVTFTLAGTPSEGKALDSYSILFGDEPGASPTPTTGSFGGAGSVQLSHTYATAGTYRARLTVKDSGDVSSTNLAEQTFTVTAPDTGGGTGGDTGGGPTDTAARIGNNKAGAFGPAGILMLALAGFGRRRRNRREK